MPSDCLAAMHRARATLNREDLKAIQKPTLVTAGDRDQYGRAEHFVDIFRLFTNGQLAIIPGCGHVVLASKADLTISIVSTFLQ